MKPIAALVGLMLLSIPSLALALDCNGDGIENPSAGLGSASAATICAAEMVGAIWNKVWPLVLLVGVPSVGGFLLNRIVQWLKHYKL